MPTVNIWMGLIIIVVLVAIGTAVVRNVTTALQDAISGNAPTAIASR